MNFKKLFLLFLFSFFTFNYFVFCPEGREIALNVDTTWSTPETFNEDGSIIGLQIQKIELILTGQHIIVVTGSHTLVLKDLTILPNDPDVFCMEDPEAKLVLENCTFLLNGTNLNLMVGKIEIIGNVEFIGLNPNIIKRTLNWILSWTVTQELAERFILDYPLVTFPHWAHVIGNPDFKNTIRETNWLLDNPNPMRSIKKVRFNEPLT